MRNKIGANWENRPKILRKGGPYKWPVFLLVIYRRYRSRILLARRRYGNLRTKDHYAITHRPIIPFPHAQGAMDGESGRSACNCAIDRWYSCCRAAAAPSWLANQLYIALPQIVQVSKNTAQMRGRRRASRYRVSKIPEPRLVGGRS